ncbi:MAG: phosphoenolpyruvate synthase [Nanoarchaeota archaeon]
MEKKGLMETGFVKWFSELTKNDVSIAGGKGASLAEMYNNHFPIPPGFMITAHAYMHFIHSGNLDGEIRARLRKLNMEDTAALDQASKEIRALIEEAPMPADLAGEIIEAYDILDVQKHEMYKAKAGALDILRNSHEPPFVAVRSSATTEDLADASFAGQQDSFLGVKGRDALILNVKKCFSSLFTARAIYYRQKKGFAYDSAHLAVVVQKMINSQKSGVMFSKNPLKDDDTIVIEAVWGLGEGIVSGRIVPDHYVVTPDLEVHEMKVVEKNVAMVRTSSGKIETVKLTPERSAQQVLTGYEIKKLAQYAQQLEEHYKKPQDIEFAIDGDVYIVQSRPITTKARTDTREVTGNVLLSGLGASPGVAAGTVRLIRDLSELSKVKQGDVLVTMMTNPDMVVSMQRAAGIITDEGGITSHAAIISREMGIPCVVGTRTATTLLKEGQTVTVDGFTGRVIDGHAQEKKVEILPIVPTRTKIKVIVDLPDYAPRAALSQAKAVGLVRLEGIIATSGKHPLWYLKKDKLRDYISHLVSGLKKIAMPFEEIWVRTSDIRSDEYVHLEGAPQMKEDNPMLGNHGIRFSVKNVDLLAAEFSALKELADEFPDKQFGIMMPQVISVQEVETAKKILEEVKMPENVKLGIMVETPAAVQIINELCETGITFVSFGTNDLTQFTLAIDRNNQEIQDLYSEMHPAVLHSLSYVIRRCKKYGVETSICGQAGSREEMARFLVQEGIDSISCNADAAHAVSVLVAKLESEGNVASQAGGTHPKAVHENPHPYASVVPIREEDIILKALDESPAIQDEYVPGPAHVSEGDVPSLNDAIPVESEHFETKKEDKVVNFF